MTRPLSNDLRQRVIDAVEGGMSRRAAAKRYGIGEATAIRWVARWRKSGSVAPNKRGSKLPRSPLAACHDELIALVAEHPDMTLDQIVAYVRDHFGIVTSDSSVDRFFARNNITYKKRQRMPASKSDLM